MSPQYSLSSRWLYESTHCAVAISTGRQGVVTDSMIALTNPKTVAPDSVAAQLIAQARAGG